MTRTILRAAAALCLLTALTPAAPALGAPATTIGGYAAGTLAGSALADDKLTFGVQAATAKKPDQRPYLAYSATPGAGVADFVAVLNYSEKPVAFKLYASDAFNTATGGFDLLARSETPKDAGSWIKLARNEITVPARGTAIVPFSLAVPTIVTPGDHVGGIVASVSTQVKDASGNVITVDQRTGIRVYLRVAGELKPELKLENVSMDYLGTLNPFGRGGLTIRYTVRNVGNVRLAGKQAVRLGNLFGTSLRPGDKPLPELLPGNSYDVVVPVKGILPALRTSATITVDPVAMPGDKDPKLFPVSAKATFWAIPWTLLALILALLIALGVTIVVRRGNRRVTKLKERTA
ncbi:hypothetical protein F4553_003291 [Allocatelliglobosispora scoriae]|uniref:DUF916 domain-containing protein n=1 Tax=Allocatelliglobosispora scoriae TaxID=643052 RepID=A0A841BT45_9ACTN|nr:DUF916 domain-containing protein [Allocatelliglobosispora scoriae]MBB5869912.1 hypothetical protein [Allocatelliglobosispora scoriae]